uniref:Uncharacterized protein n=1 Tax=Cacopsylla melanoneura TaxID=428564 RepID=A0A8D9ELP5_9HEMI
MFIFCNKLFSTHFIQYVKVAKTLKCEVFFLFIKISLSRIIVVDTEFNYTLLYSQVVYFVFEFFVRPIFNGLDHDVIGHISSLVSLRELVSLGEWGGGGFFFSKKK